MVLGTHVGGQEGGDVFFFRPFPFLFSPLSVSRFLSLGTERQAYRVELFEEGRAEGEQLVKGVNVGGRGERRGWVGLVWDRSGCVGG